MPPTAPQGSRLISQDVLLALLADARLPTGAHTQSAGLEPGLRAGLRPEEVPGYITARLRTVVRVEAATAVVARHVVLRAVDGAVPGGAVAHGAVPGSAVPASAVPHGAAADGVDGVAAATLALEGVQREWAARTPSAAMRRSTEQLGRGYLRLLRRLWAGHPALAALDAVRPHTGAAGRARRGPPRPVVLGVTAVCAGLDPLGVARLVALDDVQTVASAFLKLAPVDPLVTAGWVLAAAPSVDALAHDVAHLTAAADLPAAGAPLTEEWAETHARATERLFSA